MNYKTEFPDYDDELHFEGFTDTSWHNDMCPSFHYDLGHGVGIRVWADYKDKARQEVPEWPRFGIDIMQDDECIDHPVLCSDDLQEILEKVEQLKKDFANLSGPLIVRT